VALSSDQRLAAVLLSHGVVYELHVYSGADHDDMSQNAVMLDRVRAWYASKGVF